MDEQPREYYRRLVDMAMLAGKIMIGAGAETHRAEDTILHILATSNFTHADACVLSTFITITLSDPRYKTISITRRLYGGSTNFYKVYATNNVSRDFCSGKITIDEAEKKLYQIENAKIYGNFTLLIAHILACMGFSIVFGGGLYEAAVSFFCGLFIGIENLFLAKKIKKSFITTLLCAVTITVTAVGISYAASLLFSLNIGCQYVIVGSIMPLVPGVAITNAIRDTMQGDYVSGVARAMEAFMIAAAVGLGVAFGFKINEWIGFPLDVKFSLDNMLSMGWHAVAAVIATFIAICGFCLIFSTPVKILFVIASNAALCWIVYLVGTYLGATEIWATFFGAVIVDIISQMLARKMKVPVTVLFIGGVLPLVPGYSIYRVAYDMILGGNTSASLTQTLLLAGGIALAVLVTDTVLDILHRTIKYAKGRKFIKR